MKNEIEQCESSISGLEDLVSYHRANIALTAIAATALLGLVVSL